MTARSISVKLVYSFKTLVLGTECVNLVLVNTEKKHVN